MMKLVIFVLILLLVIICVIVWKKMVYGNGNNILLKRSTEVYESIRLSGSFNVELVDGMVGNLTLQGEENLLKHIITEVKNGKLYLAIENGYKLVPSLKKKAIQLTIPVERINSIKILGSGNIVSKKTLRSEGFMTSITGSGNITTSLDVETLSTNVAGSGCLNFSGKAKNFSASTAGNCNINAYDLEADDVGLDITGSGTIKVMARKKLKARVSGYGNIHYQGNPENVDFKTNGSGRVFKE